MMESPASVAAIKASLEAKTKRVAELQIAVADLELEIESVRAAAATAVIEGKGAPTRKIPEIESTRETFAAAIAQLGAEIEKLERELAGQRAADETARRLADASAGAAVLDEIIPVVTDALNRLVAVDVSGHVAIATSLKSAFRLASDAAAPVEVLGIRLADMRQTLLAQVRHVSGIADNGFILELPKDTAVHLTVDVRYALRAMGGGYNAMPAGIVVLVPHLVAKAIVARDAGTLLSPPEQLELKMTKQVTLGSGESSRILYRDEVLVLPTSVAVSLIDRGEALGTGRLSAAQEEFYRAKVPRGFSPFASRGAKGMGGEVDLGLVDKVQAPRAAA